MGQERDVEYETTEHVAKSFTTTAKIILRRYGRARTRELLNMLADEIEHQAEWDGEGVEAIEEPMTVVEREFGETEEAMIDALTDKERILGDKLRE